MPAAGMQAFAEQQSAVVAGLPSLEEGSFIHTQPAGEAELHLPALQEAADAGAHSGPPSWVLTHESPLMRACSPPVVFAMSATAVGHCHCPGSDYIVRQK